MTAKEPHTRKPSLEAEKSDPMQAELAELRSQLDTLKASREAEAKAASAPLATKDEKQAAELDKVKAVAGDVSSQLKGLLEGFDEELKDTKPTTLLAVFASGIVIGRLLAK
jgi:hypothetical protein